MTQSRRRRRWPVVALVLLAGTVVGVTLARRQRLATATAQLHERHGPPPGGPTPI